MKLRETGGTRFLLISTVVLLCVVYLVMLFYRGFMDPSEGRYAEAPREMVESGRWMEMRLFDYYYYEKPPLAYWAVASSITLFGLHDWAARAPLLINIVAIAVLFYLLLRQRRPRSVAAMTVLSAAATMGFVAGMCILLTDPFLTLWFVITCACLYWGFPKNASHGRRALFLAIASVSAFLGFLTKGAVAVVLPGAILLVWLFWERRMPALLTPGLPAAAALFVVLLAPVLLVLERHNPGFFHHFVYEEHLARFLGTRDIQLHAEPVFFYAYVIPVLMLPWSFFAVRAIRMILVRRVLSTGTSAGFPESNDSLMRFLVAWTFTVVIFFSISRGKMMSYILPAVPAMMVLLGRWGMVEPVEEDNRTDALLWNLGVAGMFLSALGVIGLWIISYFQFMPDDVYRISGVSLAALVPILVSFAIVHGRRGFGTLHGALLFGSSILFAVALLFSPLAGGDFNVRAHKNSSLAYKRLAKFIEPDDRTVVLWAYRPSLPFYCNNPTILFQEKNEMAYGIDMQPDHRGRYIGTIEELIELVETCPGRVFAVIEPRYIESRLPSLSLRSVPVPVEGDPVTVFFELLPPES